ncbi:hypothetical protein MUB18_20150 [Sphingobacterium sp. PCS056]|uniref:hypothetical protein n=1 Tax=Sphingobacterium sp. PCS056 TaxID=2931400 RepID=UPI00200C766C|nr:hypothetical protein [Sphingobacterium sp. PCS056]UPZ36404.1 hypothetical protein MUB18_20150 [Sphingobacterium sp. PCS056]
MRIFLVAISSLALIGCKEVGSNEEILKRDNIYLLDSIVTDQDYDVNKDGISENLIKEIPELKGSVVQIKDIDDITYINILWAEPIIDNKLLIHTIEESYEKKYDISTYNIVQNQFYGDLVNKNKEKLINLTQRLSGDNHVYTYSKPTSINLENNEKQLVIVSNQKFIVNNQIVFPMVKSYYTIKSSK